jgi:hypothetical protein
VTDVSEAHVRVEEYAKQDTSMKKIIQIYSLALSFQYTINPLDAFLLKKLYFLVPWESYEVAIHSMISLTILHVELDSSL